MSNRHILFSIVLSLVVLTGFAYWNIDKCSFANVDDDQYVTSNRHVQSGITASTVAWAFTTFEAANWHPLTWLSHSLDYTIYGSKPAGHHLTNLLLHIINTVLLFFVLRSMTQTVWRSAFVAALFAVHPLHVESVVWISERKDVLSALFMLSSLLFYSRYVSRRRIGSYAASIGLFFLGLLSKPMIVTLPFLMLVLDFWPLRRFAPAGGPFNENAIEGRKAGGSLRVIVAEKIPFFALAAASCVITVIAQHKSDAIVKISELPLLTRLANAAVSYVTYFQKTFWPSRLAFFYPLPLHQSFTQVALSLCFLAALSLIAVLLCRKLPYVLAGWLWFLGTLVPVIGIVQVGSQAMADRYAYIPIVGLCIASTWLLHDIVHGNRILKISAVVACIVAVCPLALRARVECGYWKNDDTLSSHALAANKNNFLALAIRGKCRLESLRYDEAADCLRKSLALCPSQPSPRINLGLIFLRQEKPREAIKEFNAVLSVDSNNTLANLDCGNAYGMLGDTIMAIRCYRRAISADSQFSAALHNLGVIYASMHDYSDCRKCLSKAILANPTDALCCFELGNCFRLDNSAREAISWYRRSISLAPRWADSHRQLAIAFAACGEPDSARYQKTLADSLSPIEGKK